MTSWCDSIYGTHFFMVSAEAKALMPVAVSLETKSSVNRTFQIPPSVLAKLTIALKPDRTQLRVFVLRYNVEWVHAVAYLMEVR